MPHIHEKIDYTADVFVVYQNTVLLRKHDKYKIWLGVGGHIELDEDPNEAAVREVKEEVGLDIVLDGYIPERAEDHSKDLIPPAYLNRHNISDTHEHISFVYFAISKTDKIVETIEQEKSEEVRWFTKEELIADESIVSNVKYYALKALEKLSI